MITRRAFVALFAALPFVGKLIPRAGDSLTTMSVGDVFTIEGYYRVNPPPQRLVFHPDAYSFVWGKPKRETRPRLTFAEWDQRHQA